MCFIKFHSSFFCFSVSACCPTVCADLRSTASAPFIPVLVLLTPFTAPASRDFQAEKCVRTPANGRFPSPKTHLLSVLCVLMEILSRANVKKEKAQGFPSLALLSVVFARHCGP